MAEYYSFPEEDFVLLGRITKAHGLRGEVKFFLYSRQPENLENYREIFLVDVRGEISPPLEIVGYRPQGSMAIVKLNKVVDRTFAEKLEGMGILLARSQLPPPDEGEFYYHHLIGKAVIDKESGTPLGEVSDIFSNGAQDVLVVLSGEEEFYIPLVPGIVKEETGDELIIQPPPGLLDINRNVEDQKG